MRNMSMCVLLVFSVITLSACSLNKWRTPSGAVGGANSFVKGVVGGAFAIDAVDKTAKTAKAVSETTKAVDNIQERSSKNQDNKNQDNPSSKAPE